MDFAQLKGSLKTQVSPAYLIFGADHYLVYKAVDLVKRAWPEAEFVKFSAEEPAEAVTTAVQTVSFFSNKRIIVYPLDEKSNVNTLNKYLVNPTPDTALLLLFFGEKHNLRLKNVVEVNCNPLAESLLVSLIARQIQPYTITPEAARYLINATGGFYSEIDHELTKLLAFYPQPQTLELKHLAPYINKTVDYQIYELGTAILQNRTGDAVKILETLLAGNSNDYAVFGGVVAQFRRAYYATATSGAEAVVAKPLGCSPYAIKFGRRDFGKNRDQVKAKYAEILDLEYRIKSGHISPLNALSSLIYH